MYIEKFLNKGNSITKVDVKRLCKDNDIEHLYLEIKERVDDLVDNLLKPFVAFANAKGGLLILGVTDKSKRVVGLDSTWDTQKITNEIKEYISPSVAGHFQVIKTTDANCYLIDIEPVNYIVGIKPPRNTDISKYSLYLYFVRNAHESKQLDPSLVQRITTEKADYVYNEEYRHQILDSICVVERTYEWFGKWNSSQSDSEMIAAVRDYQDLGIHNIWFEKLKNKVLNCQLKTLSENVISSFIEAYASIIEVRERTKHTNNLTAAEDDALDKLQDEFYERIGREVSMSKRPTKREEVDLVLHEQRKKGFIDLDYLSLLGCTNYYVEVLLKPFIKIGNKNIVYELPKEKTLIGLLMSYGNKLEDLTAAISDLCDSYKVPLEIKEDILNRISNEFPEMFLKDYLAIMGCFENLKTATSKALYLETI